MGVGELVAGGGRDVDAEDVGEAQQVHQDVRDLLAGPRPAAGVREPRDGGVGGDPLEQLRELTDLADEGEDQRLRVLEALPVSLDAELPDEAGGAGPPPPPGAPPPGLRLPDAAARVVCLGHRPTLAQVPDAADPRGHGGRRGSDLRRERLAPTSVSTRRTPQLASRMSTTKTSVESPGILSPLPASP